MAEIRERARYEVWQESNRPTRFVHIFVCKDAGAPLEFITYEQIDANA